MKGMDDRKKQNLYLLLSAVFFCLSLVLFHGASKMSEETERISQDTRMLAQWKQPAGEETQLAFLSGLLSGETGSVTEFFEDAGITVDETSEEFEKTDDGILHTFCIKGRGSFQQILTSFDIISTKKSWMAMDIREIRRDRDTLSFAADIRSFQRRGAYEETKSGADRPHGDWEKPGSQNPV